MSDQLNFIPFLIVPMNRFANGLLTRCCFDFKALDIVKNAALPKFKLETILKKQKSYMKRRKRKKIGERSLETGESISFNGSVKKGIKRMRSRHRGLLTYIKDNF